MVDWLVPDRQINRNLLVIVPKWACTNLAEDSPTHSCGCNDSNEGSAVLLRAGMTTTPGCHAAVCSHSPDMAAQALSSQWHCSGIINTIHSGIPDAIPFYTACDCLKLLHPRQLLHPQNCKMCRSAECYSLTYYMSGIACGVACGR